MTDVLMLTFAWPPHINSGVWRPTKFAKYLPDHGWRPTVLAATGWGPAEFRDAQPTGWPGCEVIGVPPAGDQQIARGAGWLASPMLRLMGKSRQWFEDGLTWRMRMRLQFPDPDTCYNRWIWPFVSRARQMLSTGRYAAVYVGAPPHSMTIVADMLARHTSVPLVLDMRDPWTTNMLYDYRGLRHALASRFESRAVEGARRILVATPPMQTDLAAKYPAHADKITCITNGYDPADIPDDLPAPSTDRCVITLVGQCYGDPAVEFEALRQCIDANPDFAQRCLFRWVGHAREAQALVARLNLERNVELCGYQPHDRTIRLAAESSALWFPLPTDDHARYVHSARIFEYMALGRPVLGTAPAESTARDVLEAGCHAQLLPSREPAAVATLMADAFNAWQRGELTCRTDWTIVTGYRRDVMAGRLAGVLNDVSGLAPRGADRASQRDVLQADAEPELVGERG